MRTYTGRPHDVRRVGGYENVPRLCLLCSEELPPLTGAPPSTKSHSALRKGGEVGPGGPLFRRLYRLLGWFVQVFLARGGVPLRSVGSTPFLFPFLFLSGIFRLIGPR